MGLDRSGFWFQFLVSSVVVIFVGTVCVYLLVSSIDASVRAFVCVVLDWIGSDV